MEAHPMKIKYTIELEEKTKTYRIILSLPAAPMWKVIFGKVEMLTESLNLYPDPQMIKELHAQIIETEQKGYSPSR